MFKHVIGSAAPAAWTLILVVVGTSVRGQGLQVDADGHAALNGRAVMACWNFEAGADMPEDYNRYPEFLPFLQGWDFRINLPHVHFQHMRNIHASPPVLAGVEEDGNTLDLYGHVNNSIWVFQMDPDEGRIYAKVLPSRRNLNGSATQNVGSLTAGWFPVGAAIERGSPAEKPGVAVVGKGIGSARIYVVARDRSGALHMSGHTVTGLETAGPPVLVNAQPIGPIFGNAWSGGWAPIGVFSTVRPSLVQAFDGKLALAYVDGGLHVIIYDPATNTWGPATTIAGAAVVPPQLIWDGTALNVLFVGQSSPVLQHTYALSHEPLIFHARRTVSSLVAVYQDQFHAMFFNRRLHVVIRQDSGADEGPIFYTTTTSDPGRPSTWSIPSATDVLTTTAPRVAWLNENILVAGAGMDGRVRYTRKDPNRPGNELTGAALADRWLEPGLDIDPTAAGSFSRLETLTMNGDVYLAANYLGGGTAGGSSIINFSRAAMKQLITQKWGMRLLWGEPGGARMLAAGQFATAGQIPAVGDLSGNGLSDLIVFTQTASADGQAPVYVRRNINGDFISPALWAPAFSHAGEIPMVGDFDRDFKDDLISFRQTTQLEPGGGLIGHAPVWVMLSGGVQDGPVLWHDEFSAAGEIPMVGDFNGDGYDDIVNFTQKVITDFDGGLVGEAVVQVSLSDGSRFGPKQIWHTNFSKSGEIPMVGDFNGDGYDDIITFTQKPLLGSDGTLQANAPVYVALSDGTRFGPAQMWHPFFCPEGEVPLVADLNMDGRADIITFLADKPDAGLAARNVYVAFSTSVSFQRSTVWHSDFVRSNQVRLGPGKRVYSPQTARLSTRTRGTWTQVPADFSRPVLDILAFPADGSVHVARTMGNVPYPSGAPWERYKWFTEKGLGAALFPEWIYHGPGRCIAGNHRFALNGAGGVGGGDLTVSSVRFGGRAPHILEELGHSIFANCFQPSSDPFNLTASIYDVSPAQGGMGSNARPGCPDGDGFYSCRSDSPGEHYFLQLLSRYRLDPEMFRARIESESNAADRVRLRAQYDWLKEIWFEGLEFATGPAANASLPQRGVMLLPAALPPIDPADNPDDPGDPLADAPGIACGNGAACGAGAPLLLMLTGFGLRGLRKRVAA